MINPIIVINKIKKDNCPLNLDLILVLPSLNFLKWILPNFITAKPKIIRNAVNIYPVTIYGTNQVSLLFSKLNFALRWPLAAKYSHSIDLILHWITVKFL